MIKEYSTDKTLKGCKEKLLELTSSDKQVLAKKLNVGEMTLNDIISELIKPSRDPRSKAVFAKLDDTITDIKDLKVGQVLEGTVRNIAQFGVFVDLGVEINGLIHISELTDDHFVSDIHKEVKLGQVVKVKVIDVDLKRDRIALSTKGIKQ